MMEAGKRIVEPAGRKVRNERLEPAERPPDLERVAGPLHRVVHPARLDEVEHPPEPALRVAQERRAGRGPHQGGSDVLGIGNALGAETALDMLRDELDVPHHGFGTAEDLRVDALEDELANDAVLLVLGKGGLVDQAGAEGGRTEEPAGDCEAGEDLLVHAGRLAGREVFVNRTASERTIQTLRTERIMKDL